jgi:hypothetical protein
MKKPLQFNPSHPSPSGKQTTKHRLLFFVCVSIYLIKINFPSRKHQTSPFNPNEALQLFHSADGAGLQTNKQISKQKNILSAQTINQSISLAAQFFMCCARKTRSEESNQTALLEKSSKLNKRCGPRAPPNHTINSSTCYS